MYPLFQNAVGTLSLPTAGVHVCFNGMESVTKSTISRLESVPVLQMRRGNRDNFGVI